ncbi:MAG: TraB/GumN family protein, partial [Planctomycetaceae bacterium]
QFRAKPIVWPMVLPQLEAATRFQSPGLDQQLYVRAMQTGKRVGGLENPGTQLRDVFKLSKEEQITFVRSTLDSMDKADAGKTDMLMQSIEFYLRGDGKAFHQFLLDDSKSLPEPLRTKFLDGLVYNRNVGIAREIEELVRAFPNRKHFFAVGTFHMLGERSVLNELKKRNVTTELVTDETP